MEKRGGIFVRRGYGRGLWLALGVALTGCAAGERRVEVRERGDAGAMGSALVFQTPVVVRRLEHKGDGEWWADSRNNDALSARDPVSRATERWFESARPEEPRRLPVIYSRWGRSF